MGTPNVYPMGSTIYDPEKAWSGYTIMSVVDIGAVLIDMNGNVVRTWKRFARGFLTRCSQAGTSWGASGRRREQYGYQDMADVTEIDWDGNVVWSFNQKEFIKDDGERNIGWRVNTMTINAKAILLGYYVPGWNAKPIVATP